MHPYERLRSEFLRRINDLTWAPGTSVPHEEKLAEEFQVARGTVRRALSSLVDAGLIERRKRAGTRVVDRKSSRSTLTIPVIRHEIESQGSQYRYQLLNSDILKSDEHDVFGNVPVRHLLCLHLKDGAPYQLEDRYLNLTAIPDATEADFSKENPNEWLIARVPYSSVRTTLKADLASALDQTHLCLGASEPVFVIERQTQLKTDILTHVRLSHPASRFQITTKTKDLLDSGR